MTDMHSFSTVVKPPSWPSDAPMTVDEYLRHAEDALKTAESLIPHGRSDSERTAAAEAYVNLGRGWAHLAEVRGLQK
jgi:hypothetical protein